MNIVFCKTRYTYGSYGDFWRLVTASGFQTIFIDEIDLSQDCLFVFTPWNGEAKPILEREQQKTNKRGKLIWWLLERDIIDKGITEDFKQSVALVDDVWVSDRSYAAIDSNLRFVMLGGHEGITDLESISNKQIEKQFDVCTLAYLWGRRKHVTIQLEQRNIKIAPDAYGKEAQDAIVPASHLMLNMHQYADARIIAPIRFAIAATYGLPILTESVDDPWPLRSNEDFIEAPYDKLVNAVEDILKDSLTRERIAANLKNKLLSDWRFDRSIRKSAEEFLKGK